jgi:Tol biopolymer transport system component
MTRILFVLIFLSSFAFGQKDDQSKKDGKSGGVFKNAEDGAKMILAKQKMYAGEYTSAVNLYREVEKNNPNDGTVLYYIGYCEFMLKDYVKAKDDLLRAEQATTNFKPETHVMLAKIYQMDDEFDKAIESLGKYKSNPSKDKESTEEADLLLSQCQNAKTLMGAPLEVGVMNLGDGVNSRYDDKNPCITADGSKLVFTSRRPKGTDSPVDVEGDGKYFEDIYMATYDSVAHNFVKAMDVPGTLNSKGHDAVTSISPDGKQIFIYKNDINDKASRGGEVFVSRLVNNKWKTPEPLGKPVSSSYWEGGACISPDGKKYFFTSERPGGLGGSDIWMVEKINKKEWGKPVNLGSEVNSSHDEAGMFLAPDGKTLFFCSNGPKSMGSYDVFKTTYENGKWSTPVNLGFPINSSAKEGQLTLSADARHAYISSDRKGGLGESDIYKIDLRNFAILEKDGKKKTGNGLSILKGVIREGNEGFGVADVDVVVSDEAGKEIASTVTNENGEYFFTLNGGQYNLTVKKKGYKDITEKIDLKKSGEDTYSLEKGYLLKK